MMVTGIVAEFNPFHKGHRFLLSQSKGVTVVAMSGNFVQRGEPAIVDKWTRAEVALKYGADIVVELPFMASVQGADVFAQRSVDLLDRLGVSHLLFGTESSQIDYQSIANSYAEHKEEMLSYLSRLPESLSYPQKTQLMWEKFTGLHFDGQTPNHILGLAYAKAVADKEMSLSPVQRQGGDYHALSEKEGYASATAIRYRMDDLSFLTTYAEDAERLYQSPHVSWENYFSFLSYQIVTHQDLTQIVQVNKEISNRLLKYIRTSSSLEELVEKVSTKRYTKARIRRVLLYILMNVQKDECSDQIRLLGFTAKGQNYLSTIKNQVSMVSRIGKADWDITTQRADRIYQMGHSQLREQNYGRKPIRYQ